MDKSANKEGLPSDRELFNAQVIELVPLGTHLMVADALTKSLRAPALAQPREGVFGRKP